MNHHLTVMVEFAANLAELSHQNEKSKSQTNFFVQCKMFLL